MKRKNLAILAMLVALFTIISCEKDVTTSKVEVDTSLVANLKVYVRADLDTLTNNDTLAISFDELVPDGTQLIVTVENSDLNPMAGAKGQWISTVTTTGGVFELEVPTIETGLSVTINAVAFQHTFLGDTATEERVYELVDAKVTGVYPGSNRVETKTMSYRTLSSVLVP